MDKALLLMSSRARRFINRDDFTDTTAAPLNGTYATDGRSLRTGVDTNNKISTASGLLNFATGAAANDGLWYPTNSRVAGRFATIKLNTADTAGKAAFGLDTNQTGTIGYHIVLNTTTGIQILPGSGSAFIVGAYAALTDYWLLAQRRALGLFWFIKGGGFTVWTLLGYTVVGSGSTLYPAVQAQNTVSVFTAESMRVGFAPPPVTIASDSFNRADGAPGVTDGLGVAESGGAGLTWTAGGGAISSNALVITPTLGAEEATGALVVGTWYSITATEANHFFDGCAVGNTFRALATTALDASNKVKAISMPTAICTLPLPTVNPFLDFEVSALTAGTQAGLICRLDSATTPANCIIANFDGQGNVKVVEYVAGVPNQLITAAKAFTVSDHLLISLDDTAVRCYHMTGGSTTLIGSAATAVTTGLLAGAFSTDPTNLINSMFVFPKGIGGEYSYLDRYTK